MTRIENRDAADGPSPGVIGLAVVRCAPGFGQHAVDGAKSPGNVSACAIVMSAVNR